MSDYLATYVRISVVETVSTDTDTSGKFASEKGSIKGINESKSISGCSTNLSQTMHVSGIMYTVSLSISNKHPLLQL